MPSTATRSRDPQPNVLADGVEPNRLSTQSSAGALGRPGQPVARSAAVPANQLGPSASSTRASVGDARFEARGRRAPSLATIIVIGFLLVTVFRVIVSLIGH